MSRILAGALLSWLVAVGSLQGGILQAGPSAEPDRGDTGAGQIDLFVPSDLKIEGIRVVRWTERSLKPLDAAVEDHAAGSLLPVTTRCSAAASLVVSAPGWIAAPLVLAPERCAASDPIELDWLAAGTLRGKLTVPRGEALPALGRLAVERCPAEADEEAVRLGDYPAILEDDDAWSAEVPAGCLDLRLSIGTFAPVRWTAVELAQGRAATVGSAALVRGGSVAALVTAGDSGHGVEATAAHLIAERRLLAAAEAAYRGEEIRSERTGVTDAQGWVRFDGTAPGVYYLIAPAAEERDASVGVSEPFTLAEGDLEVVEVSLHRPASLRIEVDTGEKRPPTGRANVWAVPILGSNPVYGASRSVELDSSLSGGVERLPPGAWQVGLSWRSPDGYATTLEEREIELAPGGAEILVFDLSASLYHGRVTLHGEPVKGSLHFRPESAESKGASPRVDSDDEGRFVVAVTERGRYTVWFFSNDDDLEDLSASVRGVLLDDPRDPVEVELPGARIEGRVVDEEGRPVADARVSGTNLLLEEGSAVLPQVPLIANARADVEGLFVLESLAEGEWELKAHAESGKSEPIRASLARDEVVPGVRLVVRDVRRVEVEVVSETGAPVRGADGEVFFPGAAPGDLPSADHFESDHRGVFELETRATLIGRVATFAMRAPGHARTVLRVRVSERMRIVLPQASGRVELAPDGPWGLGYFRDLALVAADGGGVSLETLSGFTSRSALAFPSPGSTGPLVLPDLAPGSWRLVRPERTYDELMALFEGRGHLLPTLAVFTVQPGGTTRVEVPVGEPRRSEKEGETER